MVELDDGEMLVGVWIAVASWQALYIEAKQKCCGLILEGSTVMCDIRPK